jgi:hypothetical protein
MRTLAWIVAVLALLPMVDAGVVISTVLYDPLGAESGGEAVQLRNDGGTAVNISGWVLASEASATDATIPQGTMLASGAAYLITDAGWSSAKDNPSWQDADHEETLTLANADSGVALKDASGSIIDAVGWGDAANIKPGLYEGVPAALVGPGKALVRSQDTGDNSADFSEGEPAFFSGEGLLLVVNVSPATPGTLPLGAALREDDSADPGVQLLPYAGTARALRLEANYSGTSASVSAFGKSSALVKNGDIWAGDIMLDYWTAPGGYVVTLSTPTGNITLPVTVLELKVAKLETKTLSLKSSPGRTASGTIRVHNQGNVPVRVDWRTSDLVFGAQRISAERLDIEDASIKPAEKREFEVALEVPVNASIGEYRTRITMDT